MAAESKQGWLVKKAMSSRTKMVWARRFVKLDPKAATIAYYPSESATAPKKPPLAIDTTCRVSRATGDFAAKGPALELNLAGGKSFIACVQPGDEFPGKSAEETIDDWASAITSVIKEQVRISRGGAPLEHADPGSDAKSAGSAPAGSPPVPAAGAGSSTSAPPPVAPAASGSGGAAPPPTGPPPAKKKFDPFASRVAPLEEPEDIEQTVMGSGGGGGSIKQLGRQAAIKTFASLVTTIKAYEKRVSKAFFFGGNAYGQEGTGQKNAAGRATATQIKALKSANAPVAISCGDRHVASVAKNGRVFVWGDGADGQLGCGDRIMESLRPYLVIPLRKDVVRSVACGGSHTLFGLKDGRVMATGDGTLGQLGQEGGMANTNTPVEVLGLPTSSTGGSPDALAKLGPPMVQAGPAQSCALYPTGECFLWGQNNCNQLAVGAAHSGKVVQTPQQLQFPLTVRRKVNKGKAGSVRTVQAAFGALFSLFVLGERRELFISGNCWAVPVPQVTAALQAPGEEVAPLLEGTETQLRACQLSPLSSSPGSQERAILSQIAAAKGGDAATAAKRRQSVSRRASKRSLSEAQAKGGDLGLRDVVDVAAGWVHACCVTGHGAVYTVGRGLLGVAKDSEVIAHSNSEGAVEEDQAASESGWCVSEDWVGVQGLALEDVVAVSCGKAHTVAGTRAGDMLAWGQGQKGELCHDGKYQGACMPVSCNSAQVPDAHVEAFACGGDFTITVHHDGAKGAAKQRNLAEYFGDLWLQQVHGRRLGEGPKLSMDDAVKAMDAMVMELAGEAGLTGLIAKVAAQEESEEEDGAEGDGNGGDEGEAAGGGADEDTNGD